MNEISVVIADDHPLLRKGLVDALREDSALRVVGEASDGRAALDAIERYQPAVAILDVEMPILDGFAVAAQLVERSLPTALIILTMHASGEFLDRALALGIRGYVLKDHAVTDICACVHVVASGRSYISSGMSEHLVRRRAVPELAGMDTLTAAERNVLRQIAGGRSTKQIAAQLRITTKTVENHRHRICIKLGLYGTNALLKFALEHKTQLA